jgi:hypothetical protein
MNDEENVEHRTSNIEGRIRRHPDMPIGRYADTWAVRSQPRVAREFCVRKTRAPDEKLIGTNMHGREKVVCARGANDVVLVDAVAADSDRADQHPIAVKRKTSGKDGNTIGQLWPEPIALWKGTGWRGWISRWVRRENNVRLFPGKTRKFVLLSEKWTGRIAINARGIKSLGEKSNGSSGHGDI